MRLKPCVWVTVSLLAVLTQAFWCGLQPFPSYRVVVAFPIILCVGVCTHWPLGNDVTLTHIDTRSLSANTRHAYSCDSCSYLTCAGCLGCAPPQHSRFPFSDQKQNRFPSGLTSKGSTSLSLLHPNREKELQIIGKLEMILNRLSSNGKWSHLFPHYYVMVRYWQSLSYWQRLGTQYSTTTILSP